MTPEPVTTCDTNSTPKPHRPKRGIDVNPISFQRTVLVLSPQIGPPTPSTSINNRRPNNEAIEQVSKPLNCLFTSSAEEERQRE